MSRRSLRILVVIAAAAVVVVVCITSISNKKNPEETEEYGTMDVFESATGDATPSISSEQDEMDTKHEVVETQEYDWFLSFRDFYEYAMSKQGQSYDSDTDYISECMNKMCSYAALPEDDLNNFYKNLEHLDIDSAIVGDLVFFFDENDNVKHMGIKGYNNHMYDLKDGKVAYEYISDYGDNFAFARVIQTKYDTDEMKREQEQTGYRHADLYAAEDDIDISVFDSFKEQLLTELNIKFSNSYPKIPVKGFYVIDIDTNAYDGQALNATVVCDGNGKQYVIRYIYEMDKLYIL